MITYVQGNLFESPAKVLVNTVNLQGVMGKGIALDFKRIYPEMFAEYRRLCEDRRLDIGKLHLFKTRHKWILNFPTKRDWRQPSRAEYIEAGLRKFASTHAVAGIDSVAFPPLGCGNGQLDFASEVRPLMERYLRPLPISVFVYPAKPSVDPPEHHDQKRIADWLRSEPDSLPFGEVWADIVEMLSEARTFRTPSQKSEFTAEAVEEPATLIIRTSGGKRGPRSYRLERDDVIDFWQQLRQYGFVFRTIAPEHHRVSYLMPVFEQLPYVRRVRVSTSSVGLGRDSAIALQVVPPARGPEPGGNLYTPKADVGKG